MDLNFENDHPQRRGDVVLVVLCNVIHGCITYYVNFVMSLLECPCALL